MNIDYKGVKEAVQQGKSRDSDIMTLIRSLYFYTAIYEIEYKSIHLYSKVSVLADALSRYNMVQFRTLNPNSDQFMTQPADFLLDF